MSNNKTWWANLLDFIVELIKQFLDPEKPSPNSVESGDKDILKNVANTLRTELPKEVKEEAITQGVSLLLKYNKTLLGLTPAQKEYAIHVAYLKAVQRLDTLSLEELEEYAEINTQALFIGIKVSEELNEFWNAFGDAVKKVVQVAANISAKAAAVALKSLILI
jgi:hypothetical protein